MSVRELAREHKELPLSLLNEPEIDLRDKRDEDMLDKIAASIARHGILQPIIVVRDGERFEIVDGKTRFICAKRAQLVTAPCYVYATRVAALEGVKYDTATMRLELTPAEEATYFHALFRDQCGEDIDAVAARVGRSRNYVDSRIALLLGDDAVFDAVSAKEINLTIAALLNQIDEQDYRRFYLAHAIKGGVTASVMTGWLAEYRTMKAAREGMPVRPAAPEPTTSGITGHDPFVCHVCRKNDPRRIPQMVAIHNECLIAILGPMLDAYHGDR